MQRQKSHQRAALTDRELQSLRNLGNESEAAADEIVELRARLGELEKPSQRGPEMTEHTAIREALAAGPTEGWHRDEYGSILGADRSVLTLTGVALATGRMYEQPAINRDFVLACNPTAIRSLLADLDTLRQRAERAEEDARRLREAMTGTVNVLEKLRAGKDGQRYCYVESRHGSMVHVADAIDAARAAIGETP